MYTDRQLSIIAILRNAGGWMKGSVLAENIGVSKRTLQMDIKAINETMAEATLIHSNNRLGYLLEDKDGELKRNVEHVIEDRMDHSYGQENYVHSRQIIALLLFERDYISIGEIADRLYFSRSVVTAVLPNVKRIIGRTAGAKLMISGSRGLRIEADENMKRIMCMKCLQNRTDIQMIKTQYNMEYFTENRRKIQAILAEVLIAEQMIVSGEAYRNFAVYLAVCIMRTELGFVEEESKWGYGPGTFTRELIDRIEAVLPYSFSETEIWNIEGLLRELNMVYKEKDTQPDIMNKLNQFTEKVLAETGLHFEVGQELQEILSGHIAKMELRIASGRNNMSNHTKEMAQHYPLEMHLLCTCLSPILGIDIPDAEMSYLVLYLASVSDKMRWKPDVLFVSDHSAGSIYNIRNRLKNFLGERVGDIIVIPGYLYSKNGESYVHDFQLRITSEQEILLKDESFIYLDIFATNEQIMRLGRCVDSIGEKHWQKEKKEFIQLYGNDCAWKIMEGEWTLEGLLEAIRFPYKGGRRSCHTIGNSRLTVIDHTIDGKNILRNIYLKTPLIYGGKQITEIIAAHYGGDGDMIAFFDYVSNRLCGDRKPESFVISSAKD